jgi:hypothetical protein
MLGTVRSVCEGWRQADCKPNSVRLFRRGDHSSRSQVSLKLKQPTRKLRRAVGGARSSALFPYLALLHVGFTKPIRFRIAGALLPHLFTLTGKIQDDGSSGILPSGMFSVALSVSCEPSHYEAHCPVEFGLSSLNRS